MDGVLHASAFQDTIRKVEIQELTYRYFKETGRIGGKVLDGGLIAESPACLETVSLCWLFSGLWQPLTILESHLLSVYYLATLLCFVTRSLPCLLLLQKIAHIQWCLHSCHLVCSCYHGQSLLKDLLCGFLWLLTSC